MGRALITANLGNGQYSVEIRHDTARISEFITKLNEQITKLNDRKNEYETQIAALEPQYLYELDLYLALAAAFQYVNPAQDMAAWQEQYKLINDQFAKAVAIKIEIQKFETEIKVIELEIAKKTTEKTKLQSVVDQVDARDVWCADLSESLTGELPTLDINGEKAQILLAPQDPGSVAIADTRKFQPTQNSLTWSVAYNLMSVQAWQKWKPELRLGTITAIDEPSDTCDVTLGAALSSYETAKEFTRLDINQGLTLVDVPIQYMTCNAAAFQVGDSVIVYFQNSDFAQPIVIGFESNPRTCGWSGGPFGFLLFAGNNVSIFNPLAEALFTSFTIATGTDTATFELDPTLSFALAQQRDASCTAVGTPTLFDSGIKNGRQVTYSVLAGLTSTYSAYLTNPTSAPGPGRNWFVNNKQITATMTVTVSVTIDGIGTFEIYNYESRWDWTLVFPNPLNSTVNTITFNQLRSIGFDVSMAPNYIDIVTMLQTTLPFGPTVNRHTIKNNYHDETIDETTEPNLSSIEIPKRTLDDFIVPGDYNYDQTTSDTRSFSITSKGAIVYS